MNANLFTKKIEMSKSEAKEAGKLNSEKFHELRQYMEMYPGFEIQIKAPAKRKVELRGLDYKYMKEYIQKHDDAQKSIMAEYLMLRGKTDEAKEALAESCTYLEMRDWFLGKFPAIAEFHEKRAKLLSA